MNFPDINHRTGLVDAKGFQAGAGQIINTRSDIHATLGCESSRLAQRDRAGSRGNGAACDGRINGSAGAWGLAEIAICQRRTGIQRIGQIRAAAVPVLRSDTDRQAQ